jgi:hypothetical protein
VTDSSTTIETWDKQALGPLTLESVKARHQPAWHFRIQQHHYEAHTPYSSTGVARTYYVVSGQCAITVEGNLNSHVVESNQFLRIPAGTNLISHSGPLDIIVVLELPEPVWQSERALHTAGIRK